ncbi:MAG: hypothetical protein ACRYHA_09055 [Janthinobacterium lividum]
MRYRALGGDQCEQPLGSCRLSEKKPVAGSPDLAVRLIEGD